jgi:TPP-dependent pyruvate/acetoin dehydrogenase alpha subunit
MTSPQAVELDKDRLLGFLRKMLEIRMFEERVEALYREGKVAGPAHLYIGQEAVAVGVLEALRPDDVVLSTYRGHGHALARGVPMAAVLGEILGKAIGTCKGLGGSMHAPISVSHNIPMATAIVGSGIPIAVGVGLGLKYRGGGRIAAVFFGDGAVNTGAFHEGLNLAAVWALPVLFVCENNLYAMTTAISRTFAGQSIAARASSYGIKTYTAMGNDVLEVYKTASDAAEYIRAGKGPAFIECRTYRQRGHGGYDMGVWYRPAEERELWFSRDPIDLIFNRLKELGYADEGLRHSLIEEVGHMVEKAVEEALKSPVTDFKTLSELVYATKV